MSRAEQRAIVVCDLDGTIVFSGQPPAPELLDALTELAEAPLVRLVIATSRSPRCVRRWFGPLLPHLDLVCCDGAIWLRPGGVRWVRTLPPRLVDRLVRRLDRLGVGYAVDYGHAFMVRDARALPWMGLEHRIVTTGRPDLPTRGVLRICVAESDAARTALTGLGELTMFGHRSGDADIVLAGTDKSVAVQVMQSLDPSALVHAFGDDENDRMLLQAADWAYLVGERLPELDALEHVRRITPAAVEPELRAIGRASGVLADYLGAPS